MLNPTIRYSFIVWNFFVALVHSMTFFLSRFRPRRSDTRFRRRWDGRIWRGWVDYDPIIKVVRRSHFDLVIYPVDYKTAGIIVDDVSPKVLNLVGSDNNGQIGTEPTFGLKDYFDRWTVDWLYMTRWSPFRAGAAWRWDSTCSCVLELLLSDAIAGHIWRKTYSLRRGSLLCADKLLVMPLRNNAW